MVQKLSLLFILSLFILSNFSCRLIKQKSEARKRLQVLKEEREIELNTINFLETKTKTENEKNNLDNSIRSIVEAKLNEKRIVLNREKRRMDSLDLLLDESQKFNNNTLQKVNTLLDSVTVERSQYANRLSFYLMVEEVIKPNNFKIFDFGAFFGPGKYRIPQNDIPKAMNSFAPIFDSILQQSKPYKDRKRLATIMVYGYSDGQGFDPNSEIVFYLKGLLLKDGIYNPTKEELNKKLSEIRALELVKTVSESFLLKGRDVFKNDPNLRIKFIAVGKGEEYPNPNKKDYKVNDENRRICAIYWIVLPDE